MDALGTIPLPAIVHLKSRARQSAANHYVVLAGMTRQGVVLIDAPDEATIHPYAEFAEDWTGAVVAFAADPEARGRFTSTLRGRNAWSSWAIGPAVAAPVGLLAWSLFARKGRGPRTRRDQAEIGGER